MPRLKATIVVGALLAAVLASWLPGATTGADAAVPSPLTLMHAPMAERISSGAVSLVDMARVGTPSGASLENRDPLRAPSDLSGPRLGRLMWEGGSESGMDFLVIPGREGWGVTSHRAASGSYSAYCAGGILPAPGPYPNSMYTQMQAAAFQLPTVGTATLDFDMYLSTQSGHDFFGVLVGPNGEDGYLWAWSGSSGGWVHVTLDLAHIPLQEGGYGSMLGKGAFGVDFIFESDGTTRKEGVYVDNVQLINTTTPLSFYRGTDRYDTAIKLSKAMFPGALPADSGVVVAPGETFPEALCGAPLAAAYGGPVLLTYKVALANNVSAELQRLAPKTVFCIGLSTAALNSVTASLPTATVIPVTGADVYEMSRNVANALKTKVGDMSAAVGIVTRGDNFPDAIGVSPLACAKLWPIILTNSGGAVLHPSAVGAIADLGLTQTLKVGTYATMPVGVTGLANLSGTDRYITNANVAKWAKSNAGLTFTHTGVATGDKFPDALAAGPFLAKDGGLLLLSPLTGPLPPAIGAIIADNRFGITKFSYIAMIEPVVRQVRALLE